MGEAYGAVAGVDFEGYCSIMAAGAKATYEQAMASSVASAMGQPAMPAGAMPSMPAPTVDPNDPKLAPIEGVSLEAYVRLLRAMMVDGASTPEQHEAAVVALGFPPGRWEAITSAWGNAVTAGPPVSIRYMQLVSDILG